MKAINSKVLGQTKYWWAILIVGIVLVLGGFAYWFWPAAGYAVISQIFGWLLVLTGIVQLCAAAGPNQPKGWGWWIASGIVNMFIGFVMVRSIFISEFIFPFFLALIFIMAGIMALCASVQKRHQNYWWLNLINGILLLIIGFMICDGGYRADEAMVSFIAALGFVYWGFTVAMTALDLRPLPESK